MSETHDLHLPHGSIWPVIMALGIAAAGTGFVVGGIWMIVGLLVLVVALLGWFNEDYRWWRDGIGTGAAAGRLGTILFMSSEVFLFGALFATYFSFRALAEHWPDQHVELPILKTIFFSVFLLSSSATVHQAEKHLRKGNKRGFHIWWGLTIVLGLVFLGGQVYEYLTLFAEGVVLGSGQFATSFYMITGTHGLHVFGGLVFLSIVMVRSLKGQFTAERHLAPQSAAMYWHFVDAIWVIVFTMLYIIQ